MSGLTRRRSFTDEFDTFDADGDGVITKDELIMALRKRLPGATAAQVDAWAVGVMRAHDRDHNGSLDRKEFATMMNSRYDELLHIFSKLDKSRKGRITHDDVKVALKEAQVPHMDADVDRVLRRMANADGDATFSNITADGVDFAGFFHASLLLPVHSAQSMLQLTSALPVSTPPPGTTPSMIVCAGFINGAVSRTVTAPMDRLRAVLATGAYPDVRSAFRGILREQGLLGFWNANLANVVQVAPEK